MTELEKRASRMEWDPPVPGTEERNKMPKSAFLSPSTRTFPYKVLIDGQWVVSEKGLRSAISVANFRGNSTISAKASKMLEELIADEDNMQHKEIDDFLKHHGILGMKWGVRKDRPKSSETYVAKTITTKAGTITMNLDPPSSFVKLVSKINPEILERVMNNPCYTIKDGDKTIGNLTLDVRRSNKEMNIIWNDIKSSHQRRGYSSAIVDSVIEHARNNGFEKVTAEVIADSKAPLVYYQKKGFSIGESISDPIWGTLTPIEMNVTNQLKHQDEFIMILKKHLDKLVLDSNDETTLKHHGILGMKWGIRRQRGADGLVKGGTGKPTEEYLRAREFRQTPLRELTNAQLRTLNERMQLERTYKDLTAKDKSSGSKIAGRILNKIGDRIVDRSINAGLDFIAGQIKRRI